MLPLPTSPTKFGVASDQLFRALHQFTDPTFELKTVAPTDCKTWTNQPCYILDDVAVTASAGGGGGGNRVTVLQKKGDVGPYEYQVIAALPTDTSGRALRNWLNDNGFDYTNS